MSNMTLNVRFLAGTNIKEALSEAKSKALCYNLAYIRFKFNGVSFSIGQHANINRVKERYLKTKTKTIVEM